MDPVSSPTLLRDHPGHVRGKDGVYTVTGLSSVGPVSGGSWPSSLEDSSDLVRPHREVRPPVPLSDLRLPRVRVGTSTGRGTPISVTTDCPSLGGAGPSPRAPRPVPALGPLHVGRRQPPTIPTPVRTPPTHEPPGPTRPETDPSTPRPERPSRLPDDLR